MLKMILTIKKKYYTGEWEGGDSNPEDIEVGPPFLLEVSILLFIFFSAMRQCSFIGAGGAFQMAFFQ